MTRRDNLYLLAVDHRRSFERLFGIDEPVTASSTAPRSSRAGKSAGTAKNP